MGRYTAYDQDGRMVADFDKSEHDFLSRYGRTPEEVLDENAKLIVKLNAEHIVRQNVEAENAKLLNQLRDQQDTAQHNFVRNAREYKRVCDENAKLRELVCKVERYERVGCHECPYGGSCNAGTLYDDECAMSREIEREKRELGVEVDS